MSASRLTTDAVFDAATLSILWGRLGGICDEAATTLVRTSFSPVVQECNDFCCALMDTQGRSIAENSIGVPAFIGTVARTTRAILAHCPAAQWAPSDVLVTNDPWIGTGHLLDFTIVMPLFYGERLVGFSGTVAHAVDIGGLSWAAHARSVFEEGIRLPIMPLMRAGVLNDDLLNILRANVRQPDLVIGDLMAQVAACETGIRRTQELLEDSGLTNLESVATELQSRTETAMRKAIRELPEGSYESEIAVDGKDAPLTMRCLVTVHEDELCVNFAGTSSQVDWGINAPLNYTYAYTAYPLKCALDPHTPKNEGSYRPIRVTAPEGSILNPRDPAPVSGRHLTGMFCAAAVYQALAQACPEKVTADSSGPPARPVLMATDEDGSSRSLIIFAWGGMGARADADGLACTAFPGNDNCAPVEIMEVAAPVRFLRKELIQDSGGPGRFRGGLGQEIAFELCGTRPAMLSLMSARHMAVPTGLLGGSNGTRTEFLVNGRSGIVNAATKLWPGDVVTIRFPGAGGYGPPQMRETMAVARDVANGLMSENGADAVYGSAWRTADAAIRS